MAHSETIGNPRKPRVRPSVARPAAWLAWSLAGLSLAMFVAGLAFFVAVDPYSSSWGTEGIGTQLIFAPFLAFSVVGALIVSRYPRNAVGWICAADGFLWMLAIFSGPYTLYGLANPGSVPYPAAASALTTWLWVPAVGLLGIYLILLFPDGTFLSRGWRYLAWFAGMVIAIVSVGLVLAPGSLDGLPGVRNPFGVEALARLEGASVVLITFLPLCILASATSLILRYRRSEREERQQIKWLAFAASLVGLTYLSTIAATVLLAPEGHESAGAQPVWLSWLQTIVLLSYSVVPVAVGVAVLKHRLYDIDLVINRALLYAALTATVVGIYVLVVGYLGALFSTGGSLGISLLATGLVAVLFQPLRERLQRVVNRLTYGERDDPYAVVSRLGQRLEATLSPEAVLPTIAQTVREALRLPYVAVALRREGAAGDSASEVGPVEVVAASGEPVDEPLRLPLSYQNESVGVLVLGARSGSKDFSPTDRRLFEDLARQTGVAAHAVRLTADLQRSRERLVTAREEERRRLRRDLHDGLGAQLAGLNVQAGVLRRLIPRDPAAADELAVELRDELRAAISDIRRLVHDLRPPALDELGLVGALERLAERYGAEGAGLRVVVEASQDDGLPPLPAAIEVAVYRIAQEALTNVANHAAASLCVVRLSVGEDVTLEVTDDGVGISQQPRAGVGLLSMRERAGELGGSWVVEPAPQGGTRVLVRLPLTRKR